MVYWKGTDDDSDQGVYDDDDSTGRLCGCGTWNDGEGPCDDCGERCPWDDDDDSEWDADEDEMWEFC